MTTSVIDSILTPARRARVGRWRREWEARMARFASPETMAGVAIMTVTSLAATFRSPVVMGVALIVGLVVHLAAVDGGNHSVGWLGTAMVLGFGVAAGEVLFGDLPPVAYTVPALLALTHNELLGLGHARRRSGHVDLLVYRSSALGLLAVAIVSVVGVTLAQRLDSGSERSWLWMAIAVAAITTTGILLTWVPARRPNTYRRKRWRPGERLPAIPPAELEIDDTVGAGPARR